MSLIFVVGVMAPVQNPVHAGDFDGVDVHQILSNAYKKATQKVDEKKKESDEKFDKAADSGNKNDAKGATEANKEANEADGSIQAKVRELFQVGGWQSPAFLVGQVSGNLGDNFSASTNTVSLTKDEESKWQSEYGGNNRTMMESYHAWGQGLTELRNKAWDVDATQMSGAAVMDSTEKMAVGFSAAGINFLRQFNPAPLIAAMYDNSYLTDSRFAAGSNQNKLIGLVNQNTTLKGIINFFGGSNGVIPGISLSMAITGVLGILYIGYWALNRIVGNMYGGQYFRKLIWKLVVIAIGIPLGAKLLSDGLVTFSDLATPETNPNTSTVLSQNLYMTAWYSNNFKLPSGVTVTVDEHGRMGMTAEGIKKINQESVRAFYPNATDDQIAEMIVAAAKLNNNRTTLVFNKVVDQAATEKDLGNGNLVNKIGAIIANNSRVQVEKTPLVRFAEELVSLKKLTKKAGEKDNSAIEGLQKSAYINKPTFSADGKKFTGNGNGLSPIAAYNFMATDFSNNNATVRTNIGTLEYPSVIIGMNDSVVGATGKNRAPGIVRMVLMLTLLMTAIRTLVNIISAGFGGLFKGAGGTAFGSSRGFGELIGGVIALTMGVFGMSLILNVTFVMVDILWDFVMGLFTGSNSNLVDITLEPLLDAIRKIPLIGGMIAGAMKGVAAFVTTIVALMAIPPMLKIPIEHYGAWVSGIPEYMGEKFQHWENNWTGDRGAGGSPLSKIGQNTKMGREIQQRNESKVRDRLNKERDRQTARKNQIQKGLSLAKGAAATALGSMIAGVAAADQSLTEEKVNNDENVENKNNQEGAHQDGAKQNENVNDGSQHKDGDSLTAEQENESVTTAIDNDENVAVETPKESLVGDNETAPVDTPSESLTSDGAPADGGGIEKSLTSEHTSEGGFNSESAIENAQSAESLSEIAGGEGERSVERTDNQDREASREQSLTSNDSSENSNTTSASSEQSLTSNASREQLAGAAGAAAVAGALTETTNEGAQHTTVNDAKAGDKTSLTTNQSNDGKTQQSFNAGDKKESISANQEGNKSISQSSDTTKANQTNTSTPESAQSVATSSSTPPSPSNPTQTQTGQKPSVGQRARQRVNGFRQALGKSLMAYGQHTTPKQAGVGIAHAVATSMGLGGLTKPFAQAAADQRNETLVANGLNVMNNLNFYDNGSTRMQAERRAESKLMSKGILQANGDFTKQHQERLDNTSNRSAYKNFEGTDARRNTSGPSLKASRTTESVTRDSNRSE